MGDGDIGLIINNKSMNLTQKEEEISIKFTKTKDLAAKKELEIKEKEKELNELLLEITKIQGEYRLIQELKDEQENALLDESV